MLAPHYLLLPDVGGDLVAGPQGHHGVVEVVVGSEVVSHIRQNHSIFK